jgi:D-xylose transport system substrate-binding protein
LFQFFSGHEGAKLMRKARELMLALAAAGLLAAGACVKSPTETGGAGGDGGAAKGGAVRIGFSMDTLKEERWQRDKQLVEQHAKEVGADLTTVVANGNDATQLSQVDNLLTRGVDVLIVAPHNGVAASAIVEKAHAAHVPVISYDRLIMNSDVDLYVSHQVPKIGEMQAQYALDHQPKGNYVLIFGSQTDNNALLLKGGQMKVLQPAIDRGDIKVVAEQYAREWLPSEARRIMDDALTKANNDIQAVVASNDGTAGGAISAFPPQLTGKVLVTGQDAQLDACQRIVRGEQTMTIFKPIKPLAYSAVDSALKLAHKEKLDAPDKINNGKIDVPALLQTPIAVDKGNMVDTVVKDGYHTMEEVYQGIPKDQWPKQTASAAGGSRQSAVGSRRSTISAALAFFGLLFVGVAVLARRRKMDAG